MSYTLEMALIKSICVVKHITKGNLVRDSKTVKVVHNRLNNDYIVSDNGELLVAKSVEEIVKKYGRAGWEVGK